ncbi:alpha/beta hydrolase family protein [Streptomyces beihaiensis]|uniref:Lipase family protein n=1 Tax=Streptomyces beihaiensis TaxID=2984495 RepID=A0ABT3U0W0_9ACTN|nr:hypothetical protein [Streptomyces beihaiensis]MCX3062247.1 lipase family protein [Streptomyces beihaiensis]
MAHEKRRGDNAAPNAGTGTATGPALELLVHGVGGTTPAAMLDDPRTARISGDATAAVYRRAEDVDAESRPGDYRDRPIREAYVWCNLTSGNGSRALWLLLLPFMVVNLAHWMRPNALRVTRTVRLYGVIARLTGLTLTVLLVAAACEVALDLTAWQCAGRAACAAHHRWLGFMAVDAHGHGGWWSLPGRRLGLAAVVPAGLTALLWYLSHRTWAAYESQRPLEHQPEPDDGDHSTALRRPGFWYGRRLVSRLRAAHTAAGLLTVAAAVGASAARYDRRPGGPVFLDVMGRVLVAALLAGALLVVGVVVSRGRSENRVDHDVDHAVVRALPYGALALLALTMVYAGWSRPHWHTSGRLPGNAAFGCVALVQGALVVALAVAARAVYRTAPDRRTVLRGFGGPATAVLACALGGVMTGGVAQRVADWLDGTDHLIAGPPPLLSWQASVIPPLLAVLALLAAVLVVRTVRRTRRQEAQVRVDYGLHDDARGGSTGGEPPDAARTRRIASTRARAALTDRAPTAIGITAAVTLLLGGLAVVGAWATGQVPDTAADAAAPVVDGAADTAQALGSWLIGIGFILLVTLGRRAYRDPSARRTVGILWDVGTFWPRAAHPFAPPCYAERAVPDLTWRMDTWTRNTGGRLILSGHSQGSVLAAAAAWQLPPSLRKRVGLLTYGCPLERLYGRWFPAQFGPTSLTTLHRQVDCWRNLYRLTDPIGGPIRLPGAAGPQVDHPPLLDPLAYGRTEQHPLPAPILGHGDYQADPAFDRERDRLLARLKPGVPAQAAPADPPGTAG